MDLKVVGAGLGRTGTLSLKEGLEILYGAPCYHMAEVFRRPEHVPIWHAALRGEEPDWGRFLAGFVATVDWPAAACWEQLYSAFPEAVVVLSVRSSPEEWWESFSATILTTFQLGPGPGMEDWHSMSADMLTGFTPGYAGAEAAMAAYQAHNDKVRRTVAPDRLIEWTASQGWGPLCTGLSLAQPEVPFPYVNSRQEFLARRQLGV